MEGVASFSIDKNGDLKKINQANIGGMRGCCVTCDSKRKILFVGGFHGRQRHYDEVNEDGSIEGVADGIFHQGVAISHTTEDSTTRRYRVVRLTPDEKYPLELTTVVIR
ncbi:MAG: beta-propeller fold lactonase family protein [bacterium LCO1.1]|uniref:Beta-propeller fold lactonase family protein n=1 Tax=Candidatus Weimeria bifida TaxID=2599074 RepID=A0A6N7IYB9_9FIRM|nr:beta-propeller fold lactonase family protein [Candidatus Weimeria bifida]